MIYNSTINGIASREAESLLESVEDRFEYSTIGEATMIVVGEQEANWTKFMTAVGLSELSSISEGEEIIYEGARLDKFVEKAKQFFEVAKSKLAEITKSFIAKIDQVFRTNASFIKKYEKELSGYTLPSDFEFKGYKFSNLKTRSYVRPLSVNITQSDAESIKDKKDTKYSSDAAEELLVGKVEGDTFGEKLVSYFYDGEKEKTKLSSISLKDQLDILRKTKDLQKDAKKSYTEAYSAIKDIIKELEKLRKNNRNDDKASVSDRGVMEDAINIILGYYKHYSSCLVQYHGAYMRALGSRNSQAKAICAKALTTKYGKEGKAQRAKAKGEKVTEGFVGTDAFLGAVEFI